MTAAMVVFAFLGPIAAGWLVVKRLWPEVRPGLRFGLCAPIGLSLAGTTYFFALVLSDSSHVALIASEAVLGCAIFASFWKRPRPKPNTSQGASGLLYVCSAAIMIVLASAAFVFALDSVRHGISDALVIWNLRARLIATAPEAPLSALFDNAFSGLHPDYPLLVPALIARGWMYTGNDVDTVPMALATLFTLSTVVIVVTGLREVAARNQAWIAGCILLGTPFLLRHGASQYADIVECCFITTAIMLYCIYDDAEEKPVQLPVLAGFAAAAAACTKNEGVLFALVLFASRVLAGIVRRSRADSQTELLRFVGGASFGLITLAAYKVFLAPPNDTIHLTTLHDLVGSAVNRANNGETIRGILTYLNFGEWPLNPVPLMAAHAAITWTSAGSWRARIGRWIAPAFVVIAMSGGIYVAYLLSPYNIEAHIQSSLNRLMLQLWPTVVILYSVIVSPPSGWPVSSISRTKVLSSLLAVLILTALPLVWNPSEDTPVRTVAKTPHIEVSRREVSAGETYFIKITGIAGSHAYVSYSVDGEPMGQFQVYLGPGSIDFHVSGGTRRGLYRFLAVRAQESQDWTPFDNDASILVH